MNAEAATVDVLDISDPSSPGLIQSIDCTPYGDGVNSVDFKNGVLAVAVEADPSTDPGSVVFFDADGSFLGQAQAGALPDMVIFTHDGSKVLVANEGEPTDDFSIDPEGSVSIIDISGGVSSAKVTTASFATFNDKKTSLINRGVRIFGPNATVAQDLEPEYIAVSDDNSLAYVACQENNVLAVVDIAAGEAVDIMPLGTKDHANGSFQLTEYILNQKLSMPPLGTPVYEGGETVMLGGFSGLWYDDAASTNDVAVFYAIPDRGPNASAVPKADAGTSQNLRPFKLPDYQARIVKFSINRANGSVTLSENDYIYLARKDGTTPITGKGNIPGFDEVPVTYTDAETYTNKDYTVGDVSYHALPYDPFGGDFEGILTAPDGTFWMCDEYRPAIYHFAADGVLIERYVSEGTSLLGDEPQSAGYYGAETLPAVYAKRRANRGFEAIAYDSELNIIYAFIQTPMYNPDSSTKNKSDVIRILGIDPANGTPVAEYVYLLERNRDSGHALGRVDKIGDAVFTGTNTFLVLERDSSVPGRNTGKKYVFEINLTGATNILGHPLADKMTSTGDTDKTLEMMTADELATAGIQTVFKRKAVNLPSIGYLPSDKPEGIALLPDGSIAVVNDNDFGLAGAGVSDNTSLGILSPLYDYSFDASNEDGTINMAPWRTHGLFMPDAITSYSVGGETFIVSANEGDSRDYDAYSEDVRVKDLTLDPTRFPDAAKLLAEQNLGRLKTTTADGDIDGDGDHDYIFSYGARSFSIWDQYGNLVYDSGSEFEQYIAGIIPDDFNSNNDENGSFDSRSDDMGPEPEAVTVGEIGGHVYAFIGCERVGGIFVYDITDPCNAEYCSYMNNRDFSVSFDPDAVNTDILAQVGDLGPEDLEFIPAAVSPNGMDLLVSSNEVSGSVSIFKVTGGPTAVEAVRP